MHPTEITLEWYEVRVVKGVARIRQEEAVNQGLKDQHGLNRDPLDVHEQGIGGEVAVAKLLDVYWVPSVNQFKDGYDVANLQVRTRSKDEYDLLVRPNDPDHAIFVHVTGVLPTFRIWGFMRGCDAKVAKYLKHYGDRPGAYFVPAAELRALKDVHVSVRL